MARTNKKGRNAGPVGRFARLPHEILMSPAYCSLNPNARALLVELMAMENGQNNGSLWLSIRDAGARIGLSNKESVSRAFDDLDRAGMIRMTKDAHFSVKASETSRARCWRLTFLHAPGAGRTDDWRQYQPADKAAARRMEMGLAAHNAYRKALAQEKIPVLDSWTIKASMTVPEGPAVHDLRTANPDNDGKEPNSVVHDLRTHTAVTIPPMCWRENHRLVVVPDVVGHQGDGLAAPPWQDLLTGTPSALRAAA